MKKRFLIYCLLLSFFAKGQTITTIAGNGIISNTGDGGPATAATINYPCSGIIDKFGNYYFATGANGNSVRKITPSGVISTVAGGGTAGFSGDNGLATNALFNTPASIAVDYSGNLYIGDIENERVRKVNVTTGIVSTVAGNGTGAYGGDGGPATVAMIWDPSGLCVDKIGNIYIAEYFNHRIRKVNTSGIISTYAGNGTGGYSGDGGSATTAMLRGPEGICMDKEGNLYIADNGNARIRKVTASGIITIIAGNGTSTFGGDGGLATNAQIEPQDITIDKYGNLFLDGDDYDDRVRMINTAGYISTIAGNGVFGFTGDNGPASLAELHGPSGIAIDSCGNLYIADLNNYRIRKIIYPKCDYLGVENETIPNEKISIYPNPAYDFLNINNLKGASTYYLQNIVGKTIQQGTLKTGDNSISIQYVPNGMYMLELIDEEGNKRVSKIIKQ